MCIHIFARWDGMTDLEYHLQDDAFYLDEQGHVGYLYEDASSELYATKVLVPEVFEELRVEIPAAKLRDRLAAVLAVAETRERSLETDPDDIEHALNSYCNFVELCERKEEETGQPCLITLDW